LETALCWLLTALVEGLFHTKFALCGSFNSRSQVKEDHGSIRRINLRISSKEALIYSIENKSVLHY
jgi:hypothetical protein